MRNIIQFSIENGEDGYYVATANDFAIVTQGKTLDELFANIKEATELYFEEVFAEDQPKEVPVSKTPSIFVNYEIPLSLYA